MNVDAQHHDKTLGLRCSSLTPKVCPSCASVAVLEYVKDLLGDRAVRYMIVPSHEPVE
jgi:hypothetical protein